MRVMYKLSIKFVFGFKCGAYVVWVVVVMRLLLVLRLRLLANITNKQKIKLRAIIFYPVATKIDMSQAPVRTMLTMLCRSHRNLIGRREKKIQPKIENAIRKSVQKSILLYRLMRTRKKSVFLGNLNERDRERGVASTDAVAGTFSKNATVKRWFPVASFCDLCDCEQNANGHQNHHHRRYGSLCK